MGGCHRCGARSRVGARFCGACGTALGSARTGVRKTVTVLFADLPRGAPGDLESGVRLITAFYDILREVIEGHGGTVERHAGDAFMAVFGVPLARDDDARRAAAAALALQRVMSWLPDSPPLAVGVNTGEVLAGDGSADQELAVGDAVVVAARLQQLAGPREVLLGPATTRLLGAGARLGDVREVSLRGRVGHLPVRPLLGLDTPVVSLARGPFIGRDSERRILLAALDRTIATDLAQLVCVLGEAGTGTSRLVREVLRDYTGAVTVLSGTCRAYGDRSAWSALIEVLHDAAGVALDEPPEAVLEALGTNRPGLVPVLGLLATLLGHGDVPVHSADLSWAVARVLAEVAAERPLVVVLEDMHLAQAPLLDVIPDAVRRSDGVPLVVIATGRPELAEFRPDWGQGLRHVLGLTLRPLSEEQATELARALLPDDPAAAPALVASAGGNPLFLTQLAQAQREGSGGSAPSVDAVVAARLDRLPIETRQVLECAAVVGPWGRVADLQPLCDGEVQIDVERELDALSRRDLLMVQDGRWSFSSSVIRDVAAASLNREARAGLHHARGLVLAGREAHAAAGFHLERASVLLRASDPDRSCALAAQAASRLAAAGLRALTGDLGAAADLLGRATALMPTDEPGRLALLPDLARALMVTGDLVGAGVVLTEAVDRADALGLAQVGAHARLARLDLLRSTEPARAYAELPMVVAAVLPDLEDARDDRGLSLAHQLVASGLQYSVRWAAMEVPLARALHHAHRAGDRRLVELAQSLQVGSMFHGPMHLDEARRQLEVMLEHRDTSPSHRASVEARIAGSLALQGDTAAAIAILAAVRQVFRDLGRELSALATAFMGGPIQMLAGAPEVAAVELRAACEGLLSMGDRAFASTLAALLAEACWRCGDLEEAAKAVALSRAHAAEGDVISQVRWRSVQAKLWALDGRADEARALSAAAVERVAATDELTSQGDVLADAAAVQDLVGDPLAAQALLRDAVSRYERKGARQAIRLLTGRLQVPSREPLRMSTTEWGGALQARVRRDPPRLPVRPSPRVGDPAAG